MASKIFLRCATIALTAMLSIALILSLFACLFHKTPGTLISVPNFGSNPTALLMSIYTPTHLTPSPPIILALHGCHGSGPAYHQRTKYASLSETYGYIIIFPSSPHDNNCWDVASTKSLTHDGGGDSNGLANMLRYAIEKYNADPKRVFVTGSSSGAMMTNVLAATYPDLITACSAYSGVAAGCLAGSPGSSPQTADQTCANGHITKSVSEWGYIVKEMYKGYNGTYPRMQLWHGTADYLVFYENLKEEIKEWGGVLGVDWMRNVSRRPEEAYTEMVFGDGEGLVAYSAVGVGHTVPVHEMVDLRWFGIVE